MFKETVEDRLKNWIRPDWFTRITGQVCVEEHMGDERVKLTIHAQDAWMFRPEGNDRFPYLKNQKCADIVILERKADHWILHIIECKRSVSDSRWVRIKEQFEGALLRIQAILGVLGIQEWSEVKFYTAYENGFDPLRTKNPALLKNITGKSSLLDWDSGKIDILSLKNCIHRKIQLNSDGTGTALIS